jgi:hypothetical protein
MEAKGITKRINAPKVIDKANIFWIKLTPVPIIIPIVNTIITNNRCCITKTGDSKGILALTLDIN